MPCKTWLASKCFNSVWLPQLEVPPLTWQLMQRGWLFPRTQSRKETPLHPDPNQQDCTFQVVPAAVRNKENKQAKNIIYCIRDNLCLEETVSQIFFTVQKSNLYLLKSRCTTLSYYFSLSTFVRQAIVIYFLENQNLYGNQRRNENLFHTICLTDSYRNQICLQMWKYTWLIIFVLFTIYHAVPSLLQILI